MTADALVRDLTAFSLQIAIIVLGVAVLVKALRLPARVRYHGLQLALVAVLVVPWLPRSPDAFRQPVAGDGSSFALSLPPAGAIPTPYDASAAALESGPAIPWLNVLLGALVLGVAGRALWLGVGLMRLRRMTAAGIVVEEPEYEELQERIGARAVIAQVAGLAQPATVGVRRAVVLLPDTLADAAPSLRRAVVAHELFHVRRHDWLFVLSEELVRTVFWFHPAMLWLTSQIQLAREEIVDELTVRATGDRRGYMQALLSFADSAGLRAAPAFARRRQLFQRILSVSKEKVMSTPRMVISSAGLVAVVAIATWFASSLFPIVRATSVTVPPASLAGVHAPGEQAPVSLLAEDDFGISAQNPPRPVSREQAGGAGTPRQVTPENPIPRRTRGVTPAWPTQAAGQQISVIVNMRVTLDRNGNVSAVERNGCSVTQMRDQEAGCNAFYDAAAAAIRQWRYERPAQAPLQFSVAVSFKPGAEPAIAQSGSDWQEYVHETESLRSLRRRQLLSDFTQESVARQLADVTNMLREVERAYRAQSERYTPEHPIVAQLNRRLNELSVSLTVLREQIRASEAVLPQEQFALAMRQLEQAQTQLRETERQFAQSSRETAATVSADVRPGPTTPVDGATQLRSPSGRAPVRVGGAIAGPRVVKGPAPVYTAEMMKARIEGTVAVEALVDEQGRVADARIIRSIPQLDEAALTTARQWEFTPTLLNSQPVPVLVMIELEFNLRK